MISKNLRDRLIVGSATFLIVTLSILYSFAPLFKPIFIFLFASVIAAALYEYYCLAKQKGFSPLVVCGILCSLVYIACLGYSFYSPGASELSLFAVLIASLACFLYYFNAGESPIGNLAVTFFGMIYLTIPLSCGLKINYFFPEGSLEDGRLWLGYVLIVSKITDTGAYFTGKFMGTKKLAPSISPKKTVEGAIGGTLLALLASFAFASLSAFLGLKFHATVLQSFWMGIVISVLAQLGDLTESLLKRDAGVKDSSHLPGLGGVLDCVDSLVFTLPFVYLLLQVQMVEA